MDQGNYFKGRVVNLLLIALILLAYNFALEQKDLQAKVNHSIGELERMEAFVARISTEEIEAEDKSEKERESTIDSIYEDGNYEGTGMGFGGEIAVNVTIEGGKITRVEVIHADKEDEAYLSMAMAMVEQIIEVQSAEVDTISGATFSSTGIREATNQALGLAMGEN